MTKRRAATVAALVVIVTLVAVGGYLLGRSSDVRQGDAAAPRVAPLPVVTVTPTPVPTNSPTPAPSPSLPPSLPAPQESLGGAGAVEDDWDLHDEMQQGDWMPGEPHTYPPFSDEPVPGSEVPDTSTPSSEGNEWIYPFDEEPAPVVCPMGEVVIELVRDGGDLREFGFGGFAWEGLTVLSNASTAPVQLPPAVTVTVRGDRGHHFLRASGWTNSAILQPGEILDVPVAGTSALVEKLEDFRQYGYKLGWMQGEPRWLETDYAHCPVSAPTSALPFGEAP